MSEERQLDLLKGPRQRGKKPPGPTEKQIHCAVADYLRHGLAEGWIWFHCPNGEYRPDATAGILKRMGVKPGVSDIILAKKPFGQIHALELKRRGAKLRDDQQSFLQEVRGIGGMAAWADSVDYAIEILTDWGAISTRIHMKDG